MMTKAFAVYDTKALCYGVPFFMPTVGSAVRAFADISNDAQSSIAKHPTDYMLFQVGEFDDSKGTMVDITPKVNLGLASDFISPQPATPAVVADRVRSEILKVPAEAVCNSKGVK